MTFGNDWGWGADKDAARGIFEAYTEAGGNFIDTACNYTDGTSEQFVGEFVATERDYFVLATKYTLRMANGSAHDPNLGGNSRKAMVQSGGTLNGKYNDLADDSPKRNNSASEAEQKVAEALQTVAQVIGRTPAQVAINWVRQQPGVVIPIPGARTPAQMQDNLGVLDFELSSEHLTTLADAHEFKIDFQLSFLTNDHVRGLIFGPSFAQIDNHRNVLRS